MRVLTKSLLVLALLAGAGCTKAGMVDARRDHLLAGPHGWIDLTLHAPAAPRGAASGAGTPACNVSLRVNGEPQLDEDGDLAQAEAAANPIGYRFVAPAGTLHVELRLSQCVAGTQVLALSVALQQDHLALLEFDGRQLALKSQEPWSPMSLDTLHADVTALQQRAQSTDDALSRLTRLALASVALNAILALVAVVVLVRRRRG